MLNETSAASSSTAERLEKQPPTAPTISLPKGGGAARGMGKSSPPTR